MKLFFTFCFVILSLTINAQNLPQINSRKIYTSADGKIYVNLNQPLYLKISASLSGKKYLLNSTSTPDIVVPFQFDHEGANLIYTPWAVDTNTRKMIYPKQNVEFIVYADGSAPITNIKFSNPKIYRQNKLFFGSNLIISLHANDKFSGVQSIYYSINGNNFKPYTQKILLDTQGDYSVKFFSLDNVGNIEKIKSINFTIDASAPITKIQITGPHKGNILSPKALLKLYAFDSLSGVEKTFYAIDYYDTTTYTKPINISTLFNGKHKIYFRSQDHTGNKENFKTYEFILDKNPPLILDDIVGSSYFLGDKQYVAGTAKLQLKAIDDFAGVKAIYYTLDGKNWQQYSQPIPFPKSKSLITLKYYAVDSVGNTTEIAQSASQTKGLFQTYLDLNAPDINVQYTDVYILGDSVYMGKKSKIALNVNDDLSGVKQVFYQIDSINEQTYTQPFSILEQGKHNLVATAFDNVNNFSLKHFSVTVDTAAPKIKFFFSTKPRRIQDATPAFAPTVKLFVVAQDNITGVKELLYSVNNSQFRQYNGMISLPAGEVTVTVKAIDYLDNQEIRSIRLIVDKK